MRQVVVEECLPEPRTPGELSCAFFDGVSLHAAIKQPVAGEFPINSQYGGVTTAWDVPPAITERAGAMLNAWPAMLRYARVDGVLRDGRFLVLETEVNEPGPFLQMDREAAGRFAGATARRLRRLM